MARKKGKSVSFDAMVKFFLKNYNIPTTKDVEKLIARIDRLEKLVKSLSASGAGRRSLETRSARARSYRKKTSVTASDVVLETIEKFKQGVGFSEIKGITGFGEKKLRNIIFRLDKIGKIKRKSRGIYIAA